jgi:hypothetical protein
VYGAPDSDHKTTAIIVQINQATPPKHCKHDCNIRQYKRIFLGPGGRVVIGQLGTFGISTDMARCSAGTFIAPDSITGSDLIRALIIIYTPLVIWPGTGCGNHQGVPGRVVRHNRRSSQIASYFGIFPN